MSTPVPSHKSTIGLKRDVSDGDASDDVGDNTETELDGVTSASVSTDGQSTEISELNEAGVRRLLGRSDFTVDLDLNFDHTDSGTVGHQQLLKDSEDDTIQYRVTIDFDNSTTSFGIAAVVKVASFDIDLSDGEQSASVSLENADGNAFASDTGVQVP